MAEQIRTRPERYEPRVVTMTDERGQTEKVYQVAPGRFQRKADVEQRVGRLAEQAARAQEMHDEPPVDLLVENFQRAMTRRKALAEQVRTQLEAEVLPRL